MKTVANAVIEANFSTFLREVENGEEVIITKEGHPIARLIPTDKKTEDREKYHCAVQRLIEFGKSNLSGGGLNWKELRDEGRKG